jgi:hypothetical protein
MKPHKRPGKAAKESRKIKADERQETYAKPYRQICLERAQELRKSLSLYLADNENGRWDNIIFDLKIRIAGLESN